MLVTSAACAMISLLFAMAAIAYDQAQVDPVGDPDSYSLLATVAMLGGAVFGCLVWVAMHS